jgi:hypothetical protein
MKKKEKKSLKLENSQDRGISNYFRVFAILMISAA